MQADWLSRERALIGGEAVEKLRNASVTVFGLGGVGGAAVEGLVRAGIENITIIDHDVISSSNLNRQIITNVHNVGKLKTDETRQRILSINPNANVTVINEFVKKENIDSILEAEYVIDAIDTVTSKICIIEAALKRNLQIISCMGTGNKLDPSKFKIADISKTTMCPLARVMRRELKLRGISNVDVLYSDEQPINIATRTPASISFVPPVAGFMLAGWVIRKIISTERLSTDS